MGVYPRNERNYWAIQPDTERHNTIPGDQVGGVQILSHCGGDVQVLAHLGALCFESVLDNTFTGLQGTDPVGTLKFGVAETANSTYFVKNLPI